MWTQRSAFLLVLLSSLFLAGECRNATAQAEPRYTIAFASLGPVNSDVFIADADGKNAGRLRPTPTMTTTPRFPVMAAGSSSLRTATAPATSTEYVPTAADWNN
jgi:hypothetical protein